MADELSTPACPVNRKRVQRLMRTMGIEAICPRRSTSTPGVGHRVCPYLLRSLAIDRANQVWSSDITYVPMERGFMYLVAVMDWHSRYVLSWRLSNTLESDFCVAALEESLTRGRPEIFNTDQGSQFTSRAFTDVLITNQIAISMDGRGRALDNVFIERLWWSVKHEDI
jgi:putative transposase